jgi:hypothetical protein
MGRNVGSRHPSFFALRLKEIELFVPLKQALMVDALLAEVIRTSALGYKRFGRSRGNTIVPSR